MLETCSFTSKIVAKWERKTGSPFATLISDFFADMVTLVQLGLGLTEDEAYDYVDKLKAEPDVDNTTILMALMKVAQRDGFFPKSVDLSKMELMMSTKIQSISTQIENQTTQNPQFPETV
jgi:hypothetical protein